jgi:hypothetical protein
MEIMGDRGFCVTGACLSLALALATFGGAAAEGEQLLATIDKPAFVTVGPAVGPESRAADSSGRVVLKVTGFKPAQDGSAVQAVVKVQKANGTEQEVHRFTVFPQAEFKADGSSKPRMFGFSLPKELASGEPIKLKVELVPLRGQGKGASLELGSADRESIR